MIFSTILPYLPTAGEVFYIDANNSIVKEFDEREIDALSDGGVVVVIDGDHTFEVRAHVWAVIFDSQREELRDSLLIGADVDELYARAKAFAAEVVGATNAPRHRFNIILTKHVPEWHGKSRHDSRQKRVKDDVCAWRNVTGF